MNNNYWEFPPEKLREIAIKDEKIKKVMLVIGICTLPVLFGIVFIILYFYFKCRAKHFFTIATQKENGTYVPPRFVTKNILYNSRGEFSFPETDEAGHTILKIYDVNVVGVIHEHDGINPQLIIPKMYKGDQVILEADPNNNYDQCAVKVKTLDDQQIGWLPRGESLQIDIFNRLIEGRTVYARVKEGYELASRPGNIGLCIEIARYSAR